MKTNFAIKVFPEEYHDVIKAMVSLGYIEDEEYNKSQLKRYNEFLYLTSIKGNIKLILLYFKEEREEYFENCDQFLNKFKSITKHNKAS